MDAIAFVYCPVETFRELAQPSLAFDRKVLASLEVNSNYVLPGCHRIFKFSENINPRMVVSHVVRTLILGLWCLMQKMESCDAIFPEIRPLV